MYVDDILFAVTPDMIHSSEVVTHLFASEIQKAPPFRLAGPEIKKEAVGYLFHNRACSMSLGLLAVFSSLVEFHQLRQHL